MATKNYLLTGVGSTLELGKGGSFIDNATTAGVVAFVDAVGGTPVEVRAATPDGTNANQIVTVGYLASLNASLIVTGQFDGGALPGVPAAGTVYVCTTAGGAYAIGDLSRSDGTAWNRLAALEGRSIHVTDALAGGTIEFLADHIYLWDADASEWDDIGPASSASSGIITEAFDFNDQTGVAIDFASTLPAGTSVIKVVVRVTTAFTTASGATIDIGTTGAADEVMDQDYIDLEAAGNYVSEEYLATPTAQQPIFTVSATAAAAGAGVIELHYATF